MSQINLTIVLNDIMDFISVVLNSDSVFENTKSMKIILK